jgi:hypothetical protein
VTAIAKALSSVILADSPDLDIVKTIALFCGIGLLVSFSQQDFPICQLSLTRWT